MANILKVNEQNIIQQLAAQGWSRRRIARALNVDRKTVRRYLRAVAKSPTISSPGFDVGGVKIPPVSTPGELGSPPSETIGPELITAALDAEVGRPSQNQRVSSQLERYLSD